MLYLWVSRHPLTEEELQALGFDLEHTEQIHDYPFVLEDSATNNMVVQEPLKSVDEILHYANFYRADVIACVLPDYIKKELISRTALPVITAKNKRHLWADNSFVFGGWQRYTDFNVTTEPWTA